MSETANVSAVLVSQSNQEYITSPAAFYSHKGLPQIYEFSEQTSLTTSCHFSSYRHLWVHQCRYASFLVSQNLQPKVPQKSFYISNKSGGFLRHFGYSTLANRWSDQERHIVHHSISLVYSGSSQSGRQCICKFSKVYTSSCMIESSSSPVFPAIVFSRKLLGFFLHMVAKL